MTPKLLSFGIVILVAGSVIISQHQNSLQYPQDIAFQGVPNQHFLNGEDVGHLPQVDANYGAQHGDFNTASVLSAFRSFEINEEPKPLLRDKFDDAAETSVRSGTNSKEHGTVILGRIDSSFDLNWWEIGLVLFLVSIILGVYHHCCIRPQQKLQGELKDQAELILMQKGEIEKKGAELKCTNRKLAELSNFKDGLTHMIAHDMRSSLNSILELSEEGKIDRKMKIISQSGRLLLNLVTNMLDVQEFQKHEIAIHKSRHALWNIVADARQQVELLFATKDLKLDQNIGQNTSLMVDGDVVTRVLVNLLSNAIKYSPVDGTIGLSTQELKKDDATYLEIKVSDQGKGISPEKLPHVFEVFWQNQNKSMGGMASTSLGLTFCKLALEAHNGSIRVDSIIGEGSVFTVLLPLKPLGKTEPGIQNQSVGALLDEKDMVSIRKYIGELNQLKVHQASKIHRILTDLDNLHVRSEWKNRLQDALRVGDQEAYDKLLGMVR